MNALSVHAPVVMPALARPRTALTRIALESFRSYQSLDLRLDGRHVCLSGQNGAGKTNLIEAISLLAPGRGLRSATLQEVARQTHADNPAPRNGWAIHVRLDQDSYERRLSIGLDVDAEGRASRLAQIDGESVGASAIGEIVRVVWLTPSMDGVFSGGASERRRFYDRLVLSHAPDHGKVSTAYEKAMRERNLLLERGRTDPAWMDALEARMAEAGALIAANRARTLTRLQTAVDTRPDSPFPKADLALHGELEQAALNAEPHPALRDQLAVALKASRPQDLRAVRTLVGPHRSDLRVMHRAKQMPAEDCSTGEQKALLVGLVLANARALSGDNIGANPLLLLDEAVAHLDPVRREALYSELTPLGGQAWLTGADPSLFQDFGDRAQHIEIKDGIARIRP